MQFRRKTRPLDWSPKQRRRAELLTGPGNFPRVAQEAARYLLLANGAVLVASISAIGTAWTHPELRPIFKLLVAWFAAGFVFAIFAWMGCQLVEASFLRAKHHILEAGYTPETRQLWREFNSWTVLWMLPVVASLMCIVHVAIQIALGLLG